MKDKGRKVTWHNQHSVAGMKWSVQPKEETLKYWLVMTQFVCISTETNCTVSHFMKWPIDVFATAQYITAICSMNCWERGVLYRTGSIGVVELDLTAVLQNCTQKTTSLCLPLLNIFTHSSILCDSIKNVAPVSLISHWYWKSLCD